MLSGHLRAHCVDPNAGHSAKTPSFVPSRKTMSLNFTTETSLTAAWKAEPLRAHWTLAMCSPRAVAIKGI